MLIKAFLYKWTRILPVHDAFQLHNWLASVFVPDSKDFSWWICTVGIYRTWRDYGLGMVGVIENGQTLHRPDVQIVIIAHRVFETSLPEFDSTHWITLIIWVEHDKLDTLHVHLATHHDVLIVPACLSTKGLCVLSSILVVVLAVIVTIKILDSWEIVQSRFAWTTDIWLSLLLCLVESLFLQVILHDCLWEFIVSKEIVRSSWSS